MNEKLKKNNSFKLNLKRVSVLGIIISTIITQTGCGTLTGIPAHGGGKRFATEQRLVSASIRSALKDIDVTPLRGHRVAIVFDIIADEGGGTMSGGRMNLLGAAASGYLMSPVTSSTGAFQVFNLLDSGTNYNNSAYTGSSSASTAYVSNSNGNSNGSYINSNNGTNNSTTDSNGNYTNSSNGSNSQNNNSNGTNNSTTNGSFGQNSNGTNNTNSNMSGSSTGSSSSGNSGGDSSGTNGNSSYSQTQNTTGSNSNATNGTNTSSTNGGFNQTGSSTGTNASTGSGNNANTSTTNGSNSNQGNGSNNNTNSDTTHSSNNQASNTDSSNDNNGGFANTRQAIGASPTSETKQTKGHETKIGATLEYKGLGDYSNFNVPKSDASLLMGLVRNYLLLNNVQVTTPTDRTADYLLYVTVDVFGIVRSRFDAYVYNQESLKAETSFEMMAFDRSGNLIMAPTDSNREASYKEHYMFWAGPFVTNERVKKGKGLLVDFKDVDGTKATYNSDTSRSDIGGQNWK